MIYSPILTRSQVDKELSKLQKLNYNQFRWWRQYDAPNKPLAKQSRLVDRILNGDFDYSHYTFQIMNCEHQLNDLYQECLPDVVKYVEKSSVLRARRKRLIEDFERDEKEKLETLIIEFTKNYQLNKKQVEQEMLEYGGSLIDFYYHIDEKYKIIHQLPPIKRRGRPRKI